MASSSLLTNKTFDKLSVNNLSVNKLSVNNLSVNKLSVNELYYYDKDTTNNNLLGENDNPIELYLLSNNYYLWRVNQFPGMLELLDGPVWDYKYYYKYLFKNKLIIRNLPHISPTPPDVNWTISINDNQHFISSYTTSGIIKSHIKISNINYFDLDTGEFIIIKT